MNWKNLEQHLETTLNKKQDEYGRIKIVYARIWHSGSLRYTLEPIIKQYIQKHISLKTKIQFLQKHPEYQTKKTYQHAAANINSVLNHILTEYYAKNHIKQITNKYAKCQKCKKFTLKTKREDPRSKLSKLLKLQKPLKLCQPCANKTPTK